MKARFLKPIIFILAVVIICSCATINHTTNSYDSYEVLNNTYPKKELNWLQTIVISFFQSAKEDQERKFGPKILVHPDNETRPFRQ